MSDCENWLSTLQNSLKIRLVYILGRLIAQKAAQLQRGIRKLSWSDTNGESPLTSSSCLGSSTGHVSDYFGWGEKITCTQRRLKF